MSVLFSLVIEENEDFKWSFSIQALMDSVFPLDFSLPHEDSQQLILLKFLILKTPHTYVVKKKKKISILLSSPWRKIQSTDF